MKSIKIYLIILISIYFNQIKAQVIGPVGPYVGVSYLTNITGGCNGSDNSILGDQFFTNSLGDMPVGITYTGTWASGASYINNPAGPEFLLVSVHGNEEVWNVTLKLSNGSTYPLGNLTLSSIVDNVFISGATYCASMGFSGYFDRAVRTIDLASVPLPSGVGVTGMTFTLVSETGVGTAPNPDPTGVMVLNYATLPVTFKGFNYECIENNQSLITWSVEHEVNTSKYEIWTSRDGNDFYKVKVIENVDKNLYEALLSNAFENKYVQIKQIDNDGSVNEFGPFVMDCYLNEIQLYPNPIINSILKIEAPENLRDSQITIYDQLGNIVLNQTHDFSTFKYLQLNLENLSSGIYFVNIVSTSTNIKPYHKKIEIL